MSARVMARLEELFALGPGPHADRPGLSAVEQEACELVGGWMRAAGLAVHADAAGNLLGVLAGAEDAAAVWTGSHLDTVPSGGRFDGALGVVAAVEAVERIARDGGAPRPIAVVAFRDEEGWRFDGGCFGSRALTGGLVPGELDHADRDGVTVRAALAALGLGEPPAAGWLGAVRPAAFVELHIEQGPRLADAGEPLAAVTEVVGMAGTVLTFRGRAAHAGAAPMAGRADALRAAAAFTLAVAGVATRHGDAVATVGSLQVSPGAANVVPGAVRCTLDVRSAGDRLDELSAASLAAARDAAAAHGCTVAHEPVWSSPTIGFDPAVLAALDGDAPLPRLVSWGGHDAGILAAAGVPAAMLFVRSLAGGVSHHPDEHTATEDVAAAVDALEGALRRLAA